jgi:pentatricopeptide repeat protein
MVFKSFSLARSSLAKGFTHGYAQSVVAGVSQNNPLATLQQDRFRKGLKNQYVFASTSTTSAIKALAASSHDHQDSGLAAYYTAWQKTQRTEDKEWSQFQFRKLIEWDPKNASNTQAEARDGDAAIEEAAEPGSQRAGVSRAYSTSQVEDFKKAVGEEQAEEIALAQVDEAIAQEAAKIKAINETARSEERLLSPIEEVRSEASAYADSLPKSITEGRTLLSLLPSPFEDTDVFTAQLQKLAANRKYAEVPAVFESMLRSGVKPSADAYNALLSAAIHLPRPRHQVVPKALDVYSDMLRRRVAPDTATYTALLELLSVRSLEVISTKQTYEEKRLRYGGLEEEGKFMLQSNETDYAILSEDVSLPVAVRLFDAAINVEAGRSFSERTYRLLITACAEGERVEDMVRIYSHMESRRVTPAADMFVPMIHAFGKFGDLRSAVECYDEYKALAVSNDNGRIALARKDNDVYAALVRAYAICNRMDGGMKFLSKIESTLATPEDVTSLRNIVGLKAFLPQWLKECSFRSAYVYASESLTPEARDIAMAAICIKSADRDVMDVATEAFDALPAEVDLTRPAMAMGAMHTRNGNIEAAEIFWRMLELSPTKPDFIEPTAMHSIALIGGGQAERGLRQGRQMFARIRDTQSASHQAKMEIVEHIDEGIEVMGQFMINRGIFLQPRASMELMWTMIENGGLVTPVAHHLLSGMGPEAIAQLNFDDITLLMQVQSGILLQSAEADAAHAARFAHILEVITSTGTPVNKTTSGLVEQVLAKLDRGDLQHRWYSYKHPAPEAMYSPASFAAYPVQAPAAPAAPAFEDQYDPYAASTDNKGSVVITELLEKTHGRSASHLNEALMKFKNMRRAGRHPRFYTYAKLITAAAKEDRLNLAHDILNLAKQDVPLLPQYRIVRYGWVTILDAMVAGCLTCGQRDLAARYHQDLLDMGAAPTANTFGLYITTLKESTKTFDEATEAVKIFLRAKAEGVEPSSFLYNALIGKLGKARRIDDCLFYFSEMRNLGIRPTSVTYGTIVNALCRVSDEKFAEELFEEMESMPNYKARPAPYHSMMQFFLTTKRDRSKVLAYYQRMRSKRIEPTTHTYKLLIDTYATLEPIDMEAAEGVLEQVRSAGAVPEAVHYSSLIHAKGCVLHDMEGARRLFDSVLSDARVRPQACLYQAMFEAMVANHQIDDTDAILADMRARRVDMTAYIANSLIHGWALAQKIEKAKAIYESVPESRREPSTYEAMTRAYMAVEDRAAAMAVVNEGLSRGYPAAVAGKILELVGGGRGPAVETVA